MTRNFFKLLLFAVTIILFVSALSVSTAAEERTVTASGTAGDNVTWTFYGDGELVIEVTGAMNDFSKDSVPPWYDKRKDLLVVTVGDGITGIGAYEFADCISIKQASLPKTVTAICIGAVVGAVIAAVICVKKAKKKQ